MRNDKVLHSSVTCPGCGGSVCVRLVLDALGDNVVIVTSNVCAGNVSFRTRLPGICQMFTNAGSIASGVVHALESRGESDTRVVVFAGDGGTADIGLQAASGAAERNERIIYICNDNEAYMNTRGQKSGTTPWGARTTTTLNGKTTWKKNLPVIMAAHHIPYVATASISHPQDLLNKVRKAADVDGFSYIHVLIPCPTGWGFASDRTASVARLAIECGMFPLYEIVNGEMHVKQRNTGLIPVENYLKVQNRYSHLNAEDISNIQKETDSMWEKLSEGGFFCG